MHFLPDSPAERNRLNAALDTLAKERRSTTAKTRRAELRAAPTFAPGTHVTHPTLGAAVVAPDLPPQFIPAKYRAGFSRLHFNGEGIRWIQSSNLTAVKS
jgi:hypothetical protein